MGCIIIFDDMKKYYFVLVALVFATEITFAQKEIEFRKQLWFAYLNQTRLTNKSGLWVDIHHRLTNNFLRESSANILRIAYTYYITDQTRLMAGYGYITNFSPEPLPDVPEHRPWQQIWWADRKNGLTLNQYLRIEERYRRQVADGELTTGYNFNWRFRYSFALTLPLKGKQVAANTPFLFFHNEIHINAGKEIANNYFDQNRLFLGLGYQLTSQLNAQLGYLFVFQQLAAPGKFVYVDAVRFFIFHNLDLLK